MTRAPLRSAENGQFRPKGDLTIHDWLFETEAVRWLAIEAREMADRLARRLKDHVRMCRARDQCVKCSLASCKASASEHCQEANKSIHDAIDWLGRSAAEEILLGGPLKAKEIHEAMSHKETHYGPTRLLFTRRFVEVLDELVDKGHLVKVPDGRRPPFYRVPTEEEAKRLRRASELVTRAIRKLKASAKPPEPGQP